MQATSDKTASANFTQTAETVNVRGITGNVTNGKTGYNPYFQWGRKDAFRSKEYTAAPAANTSLIYSATSVTVGVAIKNPTTFYSNNNNPYNASFYYNAWNATYTTYSTATTKIDGLEKVVKTVYDPCPVGYNIPAANTFTGLNTTNCTVDGNGRKYTTNGETLYFPIIGERSSASGALYTAAIRGTYWLAVASSSTTSRYSRFMSTSMDMVMNDGNRAYAISLRPVREN